MARVRMLLICLLLLPPNLIQAQPQGVLIPLAESDAAPLTEYPQQRTRTALLIAVRGPGELVLTDPAATVQGDYYALQALQQQRDLLFWHLPRWSMFISLFAALILALVWHRQRDGKDIHWLLIACLGGQISLLMQLSAAAWIQVTIDVWFFGLLVLSSATLVRIRHPDLRIVIAAVVLLASAGCVEAVLRRVGFSLPQHPGLVPPLAAVTQFAGVIAALYFLVSRDAANQQALAQFNLTLERRVMAASAELEHRYEILKRDSLEAAAMHERRSIYQSIHEDLSDKLLQLFYGARSAQSADLARAALNELRDSRRLHPERAQPLTDVLDDIISELRLRCEQAGIALDIRLECPYEVAGQYSLSARECSAVSRTLREALSNLLKHAKASAARIAFDLSKNNLIYTVTDNGAGMAANVSEGRGLINMRNRIGELGGELDITKGASGGTRLTFRLPLRQPEPWGKGIPA